MSSTPKRARLKKVDREAVAAAAAGLPPSGRVRRRVEVVIVLEPRQRPSDADSYHKSLLDAMVEAGLLYSDSPYWVELPPVRFYRGMTASTTVILTDLPPIPEFEPASPGEEELDRVTLGDGRRVALALCYDDARYRIIDRGLDLPLGTFDHEIDARLAFKQLTLSPS